MTENIRCPICYSPKIRRIEGYDDKYICENCQSEFVYNNAPEFIIYDPESVYNVTLYKWQKIYHILQNANPKSIYIHNYNAIFDNGIFDYSAQSCAFCNISEIVSDNFDNSCEMCPYYKIEDKKCSDDGEVYDRFYEGMNMLEETYNKDMAKSAAKDTVRWLKKNKKEIIRILEENLKIMEELKDRWEI